MRRTVLTLLLAVSLPALSGCYVEPGQGTAIDFDGDFAVTDGEFMMDGHVELAGGVPSKDAYRNISLELYAKNGTLLYKERLGTLHNRSDQLNISVTLDVAPHYVIFDSPDIWDGETTVDYYERNKRAHQGYQVKSTTVRQGLPITPDG